MPESIAALLQLVRILRTHGRRLVETVHTKGETPQFASIGVAFGSHNLPVVLARIQRGILRLMPPDAYLCQRTQKGREIAFQKERDKRPDTWEWKWRDWSKDRMRQVLGYLIGVQPPDKPVAIPA